MNPVCKQVTIHQNHLLMRVSFASGESNSPQQDPASTYEETGGTLKAVTSAILKSEYIRLHATVDGHPRNDAITNQKPFEPDLHELPMLRRWHGSDRSIDAATYKTETRTGYVRY